MPERWKRDGARPFVAAYCAEFGLPMPGTSLRDGEYALETLLGVGGMGAVYRAVKSDNPGQVQALKLMRPRQQRDRERFVIEGQSNVRIDDPRFVNIKYTWLHDPTLFYTMECVAGGKSVSDLMKRPGQFDHEWLMRFQRSLGLRGAFFHRVANDYLYQARGGGQRRVSNPTRPDGVSRAVRAWFANWRRDRRVERYRDYLAAALLKTVAEGIHELHTNYKLVHLDIKASNILISDRRGPLISDLGLCRRLNECGLTEPAPFAGTPEYAPPEQMLEPPVALSPASDVYSLGITLRNVMMRNPASPRHDRVMAAKPTSDDHQTQLRWWSRKGWGARGIPGTLVDRSQGNPSRACQTLSNRCRAGKRSGAFSER